MAEIDQRIDDWGPQDVQKLLYELHLDDLVPAFRKNAVNGKDLLVLCDDDLSTELGMTKLQIRKLRTATTTSNTGAAQTLVGAVGKPADSGLSGTATPTKQDATTQLLKQSFGSAAPVAGVTPYIPDQPPPPAVISPGTPIRVEASVAVDTIEAAARQVPQDLLTSYKAVQKEISELARFQVETKLVAAQQQLTADRNAARHAEQTVRSLQAALQKEQGRTEKASEGYFPGKLLGLSSAKARQQAKVEKLQESSSSLESQLADATATMHALQSAAQSSEAAAQSLQQKLLHYRSLQQQQEMRKAQMINSLSDATLQRLAADIAAAATQLSEVQQRRGVDTRAISLLSAAKSKLAQAAQQLQKATGVAGVNAVGSVMRPRNDRMLAAQTQNVVTMRAFEDAAQLVQSASGDVMQAKQLVPTMPTIAMQPLGRLQGMTGAVVINNVISNVRVRRSAEQNAALVQQMLRSVDAAARWLQDRAAVDAATASSLESLKAVKAAERNQRCEHILQRAIDSTDGRTIV